MKKNLIYVCIAIVLSSCINDPIINIYSLQINVETTDEIKLTSLEGIRIELRNKHKEYSYSVLTDADGKFNFQGLEAGFYDISATHSAIINGDEKTLNGISTVHLMSDTKEVLNLIVGKSGKFVIREYYYGGCLTPAGKSFLHDQYIEIYNNTDDLLYADGLSIAEHGSYGTQENEWNHMSKDSIVVKMIWTVPGNGRDYPILPGKGFIIARDASDHRSDPRGNPNSPVNLGDADFEFWSDKKIDKDIDFSATNMIETFWVYKGYDVVFNFQGKSALALVYLPKDKQKYISNNRVLKKNANRKIYFCRIHNRFVEDAVEVMADGSTHKRFDTSLDAGLISNKNGAKTGLCIRRKIYKKINGRTIYMDTNNSTNDFKHDVAPSPKNYEF